jgi:hypothetical protein
LGKRNGGNKHLITAYPDPKFWESISLSFPINSLAFFKTPKGIEFLKKKFAEFNFVPIVKENPVEHLSSSRFGENLYNTLTKKKTLYQLLD